TRTIGNSSLRGDQILAIDGRPFNSYLQYIEALASARPGESLRLTLSDPSGRAFERSVRIPSEKTENFDSRASIAVGLCINLVIPVIAIVLGFTAAAIRPRDWNAWLLLFMLLGFSETARRSDWYGPYPDLTF